MAEYIDRNDLMALATDYGEGQNVMMLIDPKLVKKIPTAYVIERSKINKAIEEIEDLDPITERVGLQVKQEILNILKRNIGE